MATTSRFPRSSRTPEAAAEPRKPDRGATGFVLREHRQGAAPARSRRDLGRRAGARVPGADRGDRRRAARAAQRDEERALARCRRPPTQRLAAGEKRALLGIPIVLKDIFATRGHRHAPAARASWRASCRPYDADAVERFARAGAVLIGKANMDEFAMGSSTENSAFGPTAQPVGPRARRREARRAAPPPRSRAGECLAALGTDTGGSIRLPASYCGMCGLKPTYGRVSRFGVIAYASSLDQVGPFARTVRDICERARRDRRATTRATRPRCPRPCRTTRPRSRATCAASASACRASTSSTASQPDGERAATEAAIDALRSLGAMIVDVELPHTEYAIATYYLIATAEASSNLARYDGVTLRAPREDGPATACSTCTAARATPASAPR